MCNKINLLDVYALLINSKRTAPKDKPQYNRNEILCPAKEALAQHKQHTNIESRRSKARLAHLVSDKRR
jgi:hypothetical protein